MGRKTHESIGRPLPGRRNIVISRDKLFPAAGFEVTVSLDAAIEACQHGSDEIFVIGGAQIYAEALPYAQRLYLTEINRNFVGNVLFPAYEQSRWRETFRQRQSTAEGLGFDFVVYDRS